jgi:ABC-type bacteriocin/lantibiotic exporter with double-glycine peptidase domain
MVLAYWGKNIDEARLATVLDTEYYGTVASNIRRLEQFGFSVTYKIGAHWTEVTDHLENSVPVIALVQTGDLPYWQENTAHVIVLVGIEGDTVFANDPAFAVSPQKISIDDFILAWSEIDYRYAAIQPTKGRK